MRTLAPSSDHSLLIRHRYGSGSVDFCEFVTLMAHKMGDTKNEVHLKEAFALFDQTGDGFISSEEMRRLMINVGEPVTIEDVNGLISEVDLNDDGVIDYEEFTKVVTSEKAMIDPEAAENAQAGKKRRRSLFKRKK